MKLLVKNGFVVKVTDMVAIEVSDAPGGLSDILAALEKTHVNLEYMYGFTLAQGAQRNAGLSIRRPGPGDRSAPKAGHQPCPCRRACSARRRG